MARKPWEITREMFLSDDEVAQLLTHVRRRGTQCRPVDRRFAALDRLIAETLLFSGLRCSEFCRLRLADFVPDSGGGLLRVSGTRGSGRNVWIPVGVARLLRRYIGRSRAALLAKGEYARAGAVALAPSNAAGPLIVTERGRAFERTGLYRRVVAILTDAGLGARASVQLLRHTYGYLAYQRTGGNLLFVQRQLGHAHPMITSIYAQFVDEDYAALAESVTASAKGPRRKASAKTPSRRRAANPGANL